MPFAARTAIILSTAAALARAPLAPLARAGPHGLPLLPSGEHLTLDAPGWVRGVGTGGRVWPAAGTLARQLLDAEVLRGGSILELGAGSGALGCWASAALGGELRLDHPPQV